MHLPSLNLENAKVIYSQKVKGEELQVFENKNYRWLTIGGEAVQSLMKIHQPKMVVLPVSKAMLAFLLFVDSPENVLNLGMGAGTTERFFVTNTTINLTSVEINSAVIHVAKRFFHLPLNTKVHYQTAESFIAQTDEIFDAILLDVFIHQQMPTAMLSIDFYFHISRKLTANGVVTINFHPLNEQDIVQYLLLVSQAFKYVGFFQIEGYDNVVIVVSHQKFSDKRTLCEIAQSNSQLIELNFSQFIEGFVVLPPKK